MKLILLSLACLQIVSCANLTPEQQANINRASLIVDRLIVYGERRGTISKEDATLVRDVGTIALPTTPTSSKVVVEVSP